MEQEENKKARSSDNPCSYTLSDTGRFYSGVLHVSGWNGPNIIYLEGPPTWDNPYVSAVEHPGDIESYGTYRVSRWCGPGEGEIEWVERPDLQQPWTVDSLTVTEQFPTEQSFRVSSDPEGVFSADFTILCGYCAPYKENEKYDFDDLKWQVYASDYIGYYLERGKIELMDFWCHDAVLYCEKTFASIDFEYHKRQWLDDGGGGTVDVTVDDVILDERDKGGGLYEKGANIVWGCKVQVKAIPDDCHEFARWEVVSSSTGSDQYELYGQGPEAWFIVKPPHRYDAYGQTIYENITYRAIFSQKKFIVYAHVEEGKGRVFVDNKANYAEVGCGNSARLIAEPGKCQKFIRWEDDLGNVVSVHPEHIELNVDETCDFYAFFEKKKTVGDSLVYDEETGHLIYKCRSLMYGPVCQ